MPSTLASCGCRGGSSPLHAAPPHAASPCLQPTASVHQCPWPVRRFPARPSLQCCPRPKRFLIQGDPMILGVDGLSEALRVEVNDLCCLAAISNREASSIVTLSWEISMTQYTRALSRSSPNVSSAACSRSVSSGWVSYCACCSSASHIASNSFSSSIVVVV
jgi:hypothetical protein